MSYNKLVPMIVAIAATGFAAVVQAAPSSHPGYASNAASVRVTLSDLDLASPAGAEAGLRRIHNAAEDVCSPETGSVLEMRRLYQSCVHEAVNRAVDRVGNPNVSALNSSHRSVAMASAAH